MRKKFIIGILLIGLIFLGGCVQPASEAEQIMARVIAKYDSLDTYEATQIMELKSNHIKKITRDTLYKKPNKYKSFEDDGTIIFINAGIKWDYNPEDKTACKSISKMPSFSMNYLTLALNIFTELYDLEYLGKEETNGKEFYVMKLIPKQKTNPYTGDEMDTQKVWITEDYLLAKTESYKNGAWYARTTYTNIETNPRILDAEFQLPSETEILPKTMRFSNIENAKREFANDIITPTYIPSQTKLDYIEVNKQCGGSSVMLNYKKGNEIVLSISERISRAMGKEEISTRTRCDGDTGLTGPYGIDQDDVIVYYDAIIHGCGGWITGNVASNYITATGTITNVWWVCDKSNISYSVETIFDEEELTKILESLRG